MTLNHSLELIGRYGLVSPSRLTVAITRHCNLRCRHCWVESGPDTPGKHVDAATLKNTLSLWIEAGVEQICLSGGEPLTHPQWQDILLHCAQFPSVQGIRLQTNGTLLTEETVAFLAKPELARLHLQGSLDGATAATHDLVRGQGNHARTLAGLKLLVEAGLGPRTTVSFTEMAHSFDELPELLKMLDELQIGHLVCGTLINGGRAMDSDTLQLPSPDQYTQLIERFRQDPQLQVLYRKMGTLSCLEWFAGRKDPSEHHCAQCMEAPYINTEGVLYPCGLFSFGRYGIAGAWNCPLEILAEKAAQEWARLRELSQSRAQTISQCQSCSGQHHCQSGCMGRVSQQTVDFMEVEDRCLLRKRVYALPD